LKEVNKKGKCKGRNIKENMEVKSTKKKRKIEAVK